MEKTRYKFSGSATDFYFNDRITRLQKIIDRKSAVLITDENVYNAHAAGFKGWNTIILKPGEEYKVQETVDAVIGELIQVEADRKTTIVGVGGGVVTDISGYVASVYMRGLPFGFIPTSLLALVDASIGGKNGIDVGIYKNMVGVIRQPSFILHDMSFLSSLPEKEWQNGFAEIIKHACIADAAMFRELESTSLEHYRSNKKAVTQLIRRNAEIKAGIVQKDEFEKDKRRLLNFGHTLGHALENQYELMHGQAVAIGMVFAAKLSEKMTGFAHADRVTTTIAKFGLPTTMEFDKQSVYNVLRMDKKRERKEMNFILLDKLGKGIVRPIPLKQLEKLIGEF